MNFLQQNKPYICMKISVLILCLSLLVSSSCKQGEGTNKVASEEAETVAIVTPMNKQIETMDGVNIAYTQHSVGDNILLFVHGWSCDQTYWKEQVDHFKSDYQVITMDLAGHGLSSQGNRSEWTISGFAADVVSLVNSLEYKQLNLVGHSLGSMVVLEAAKEFTKENTKVVCVDYLKTPLNALPIEVVTQFMAPFEADFVNSMKGFVTPMFNADADSTIREWVMNDMASAPPGVAIPSSIDLASKDFTQLFSTLVDKDIPRYIINSDATPTDASHYQDSLGFQIAIIPETNHFLMMEKPYAFNAQLKNML